MKPVPIPATAGSSVNHAQGAARYVGTNRCTECHPDQHASFLQTAHSRSLSKVDPSQQPPDGLLDHAASGRRYRAYRNGGELRHSESLPLPGGQELLLGDHPLRYLVGSGRFARTYLVEDQSFLVESPLTWYAALGKWAMSPGFDRPHHRSFHRTIEHGCLFCHAGKCRPVDNSDDRLELLELAIGCERCHGPGSQHVERRTAGGESIAEPDETIVNPRRLPRDRAEAICHQCHLTSAAQVAVRGRSQFDFRPGELWQDFVLNYDRQSPPTQMTVVGHVAQIRQSPCYQRSQSLTCLTCHPAHTPVPPGERTAHHRAICRQCHADKACGVTLPERTAKNGNNCTACHMPSSPTDVPHVAFTHHRIGIHRPAEPAPPGTAELLPLAPVLDSSHHSDLEQRRGLALAYVQLHRDEGQDSWAQTDLARARPLVESVVAAGLLDAPLTLASAELAGAAGDLTAAREWAERTLHADFLTSNQRASALRMLAGFALQDRQDGEARDRLETLTAMCRDPRDWFLLGVARQRLGDNAGAIAAFERVIEIDPAQPQTYDLLANLYAAAGEVQRSRQRRERARIIHAHTGPRNETER